MDKRLLRWHDVIRVWYSRKSRYAYSKNNTFTVEFKKIDELTIFIVTATK